MVRIGTSGYSYDDWLGYFYPKGTQKSEYLTLYSQRFDTVEVNYTYYRMPSSVTFSQMAAKVGDGFVFTVKALGEMTHEGSEDAKLYAAFAKALQPLAGSGRLGPVLLQFPNSYRLSREGVNHLAFIREQWPEMPLVVEFRHRSWVDDERTFDFLKKHNLGYCCVDQPRLQSLVPPVVRATADVAYVRFHGRNYQKWFKHDEAWERYDYLYTADELGPWVERVGALEQEAETTYVMFNNHYHAQAVQNALEFAEMLEG